MTLKRKDTPESRAYWESVEKVAAYVNSHALCFSNHCVVLSPLTPCTKAKAPTQAEGERG